MEQAIVTAVTDDTSEAKVTVRGVPTGPASPRGSFGRLADRAINVDMIVQNTSHAGHTDISFTVPRKRPRSHDRGVRRRLAPAIGAAGVTSDDAIGRVSLDRRGHEDPPWRDRHDVRDPRRVRHQHRDDLDLVRSASPA